MSPRIALAALACLGAVAAKVYSRCDLVRELSLPRHRIPSAQLATWVCIAWHESRLNTSAVGNLNADGSGDHGLFQISDRYWCSPPGRGQACGLSCDQLEDDDITDDVVCARRVYRATRRRTGDGFDAWAVYPRCRDPAAFAQGCDDDGELTTTERPEPYSATSPEPVSSTEFVSSTSSSSSSSSTEGWSSSSSTTDASSGSSTDATSASTDEAEISRSLHRADGPFVGHNLVSDEDRRAITSFLGARTSSLSHSAEAADRGRGLSRADPESESDPLAAWLRIHHDPRFLDRL